jgi:hypothetical protein
MTEINASAAPIPQYKVEAGQHVRKVIDLLFHHAKTHQDYINDLAELRQFLDAQIAGATNLALAQPLDKPAILLPKHH